MGLSEWQNESLNSNCAWVLAVNLQKIWNFTQPILFRGFSHWSSGNRASGRTWRKWEHTGPLASKLANKSPLKSSLLLKHIQDHALSDQPGVLQGPTGWRKQTIFMSEILNLPRKALWYYCSRVQLEKKGLEWLNCWLQMVGWQVRWKIRSSLTSDQWGKW